MADSSMVLEEMDGTALQGYQGRETSKGIEKRTTHLHGQASTQKERRNMSTHTIDQTTEYLTETTKKDTPVQEIN